MVLKANGKGYNHRKVGAREKHSHAEALGYANSTAPIQHRSRKRFGIHTVCGPGVNAPHGHYGRAALPRGARAGQTPDKKEGPRVNPFRRIYHWYHRRKVVHNSEIQVFASRKTTLPLEHCNAEQLLAAARYDRRKAAMNARRTDKQHKVANAAWYEIAADALEGLAAKLEDGQTVATLPMRKRKREMEMLLRISTGKAK